mmetsp:Transcript_75569/g.231223  ORF Transcript_75569/g.231223 Transcript_75569/m.231223 type:complete len:246 (-) Transcript_75569:508-1245(-)
MTLFPCSVTFLSAKVAKLLRFWAAFSNSSRAASSSSIGIAKMLWVLKPVFLSTSWLNRLSAYASGMLMTFASTKHCPAMPARMGMRISWPVSVDTDQSCWLGSSTRNTVARSELTILFACMVMVRSMDCVPKSCEMLWIVFKKPVARSLVAIASRYSSALRMAMPTCCVRCMSILSSFFSNGTAQVPIGSVPAFSTFWVWSNGSLLIAWMTPMQLFSKSKMGMAMRLRVVYPVLSSKLLSNRWSK